MGYELHIERKDNENKITVDEWTDFIDQSPDFEKADSVSATNPQSGMTLTIDTPNCGLWKPKDDYKVPFTFQDKWGHITVKNPDEFVIKKMIEISGHFNGRVVGEEGEEYDDNYFSDNSDQHDSNRTDKKWWEFWK